MSTLNCKRVTGHIIDWLNGYVNSSNLNGFIVGVSGGVDSALVATLAAKTGKQVILLNMPIYQANSELTRAQKQIKHIEANFPNVKGIDIELTKAFKQFKDLLPNNTKSNVLALANSRSRLRMMTLYAVGQEHHLLVTGTGNKVEDFGIGFFTKYGDGGVDISPIADLYKSEVYQLAKFLGVIPEILDAQPTDGLWEDERNDEDQIGATYDELEFAMQFSGDISSLNQRQKEVIKLYQRFNSVNHHKMNPIPVCDLTGIK